MRKLRKFREYSPYSTLGNAIEFINHLIKIFTLNSSTIEKHASHLRSYFKECLVIGDEELDDLNL